MSRIYPQEFLNDVPARLRVADAAPSEDELRRARETRKEFLLPNEPEPFMDDIVRAFRLLAGCRCYVEIGTYDKGNLAYVAQMLAPDATLVDVDIAPRPAHAERLERRLAPGQRVHAVVGDSMREATCERVRAAVGPAPVDAIFIDGNHTATAVLTDYALYSRLVQPGGLILFHDVYWAGDDAHFGSALALEHIDRLTPVYVVLGRDPVHRFLPFMTRESPWGGVGMILKEHAG